MRTDAEWNFVGLPDLAPAGKQAVLIPWQVYPSMQRERGVRGALHDAGFTPDTTSISSAAAAQRSLAAAQAAQAAGFPHVYNVADGFEGPPDGAGHRGTVAGWKAAPCPGGSGRR